MEYKEPKTRQESKGKLNKKSKDTLYQQKRVRQLEAILEKRASQSKPKNWTHRSRFLHVPNLRDHTNGRIL